VVCCFHDVYGGLSTQQGIGFPTQQGMLALQVDSARKLLQHDWLHVLPGHGRPVHFASIADRSQQMDILLQAEK